MCRMCFDFSFCTHDNSATTCFVGFAYTADTIYITTSREIRCLDVLHQTICINIIVINVCNAGIDYFRQVMSRHVGSHTYGNTRCTVYQQIRDACRHNGRFLQCIVKVRGKVNCFLIQISHQVFTHLLQTRFGITHSRCTVTVNRTEVTLTVYKRISHSPILSHTNQCTIYRRVSMRVVLT